MISAQRTVRNNAGRLRYGGKTTIELRLFDVPARILATDRDSADALSACYSAFVNPARRAGETSIELEVVRGALKARWHVTHENSTIDCQHLAELIYTVEKTLTIELQRRRSDLFFLHSAAVGAKGQCILVVGESGAGKSTLVWDLCNAGFRYLSDELVPVDPATLRAEAYPRAIGLKRVTEGMPALPDSTLHSGSTLHIPIEALAGGIQRTSSSVRAIVFLQNRFGHGGPILSRIPGPEAAARLYANGLNQLAHEHHGLQAAARLAVGAQCFVLTRGRLSEMRERLIHLAGLFSE